MAAPPKQISGTAVTSPVVASSTACPAPLPVKLRVAGGGEPDQVAQRDRCEHERLEGQ